jgi:hypothetical protein
MLFRSCIVLIVFSMCSFEVQILPKLGTMGREQFSLKDGVWNLTTEQRKERTAQAFPRVSDGGKFCLNFARASLMLSLSVFTRRMQLVW